jgi:transcriptional regulator with GAF, ATPase, and Fis domain
LTGKITKCHNLGAAEVRSAGNVPCPGGIAMPQKPLHFYRALFEELAPQKLQENFLRLLLEIQGVERGSLWVRTPQGYLCLEAAGYQSEKIKGVTVPATQASVVGWVIDHGQRTVAEAGRDERHFKEMEEGLELKSSRILCFPLFLGDGSVYGAVEIIETPQSRGSLHLEQDYLELLQTLVDIGSMALSHALAYSEQVSQNELLQRTLFHLRQDEPFICHSRAFARALEQAASYARTDFPVLVTGESGTGKELVAREIHRRSPRRDKTFLAQNCSAIPETLLESELFGYKKGAFTGALKDKAGLFEAAHGGTILLDEIGDMPLNLQAKILRVLQEGEVKPLGGTQGRLVDVRIIAATNRDLGQAIAQREFREDLFFRLNVLPLALPPLRQRREDIAPLLNFFLKRETLRLGGGIKEISPPALAILLAHPWPGNVRELENFVKYLLATVGGPIVTPAHLPDHLRPGRAVPALAAQGEAEEPAGPAATAGMFDLAGLSWEGMERRYVLQLMERHRWNVTKAAEEAGVNRSTFDSRLKKLGIRKR